MATAVVSGYDKPVQVVTAVNSDGTTGQQVQGTAASGATAVGNPLLTGGLVNTTTPGGASSGQVKELWLSTSGAAVMAAATFTAADAIATAQRAFSSQASAGGAPLAVGGYVFNGTGQDRQNKPRTTARLLSAAASTNATSVKTSAGDLFSISGYNANAAARYLKLYNKASAPTVGSDTPIWTEYLPATSKFTISLPTPMYFSTGIAYAITTAGADADTGALTAGDILAMTIAYA